MFRTRTIGERTLENVHAGIEKGLSAMERVVDRGQEVVRSLPRRQARRRGGDAWLWLASGAVAAGAMMLGSRRAAGLLDGRHTVGDVMVRDVQTVDGSMNLTQVAERMRDSNVGVLPVMEGGRLRGIVTDRDLVIRGLASGANPSTLRVADCATHSFVAARPDWSLQRAMDAMAAHQIGRLPVVDETERVVGIVTLSSLALRSARGHETLDTAKRVSRRSARAV